MELRRPNRVRRNIPTFGKLVFLGTNMGIDCQEAVVLCGHHEFDKTLLQHSLGSLEGLFHLLLLFEDHVMERVEDIIKLLFNPSCNLTVSGTVDLLIDLSHYLYGNHGIQ
jgi:hypothetical protein